jgi:hypothetical protein
MWQQMISFFKSWFVFPGVGPEWILIAVGLAIAFGAIWLLVHQPPLFKRPWLWVVAVVSAFLTLLAITFVQIPLQTWTGEGMFNLWGQETVINWIWVTSIPPILLSGLVQEGAKMVPMVAWWWNGNRTLDPRLGLAIGAIAGAGFGIYEAFWVHANIFGAGWTWAAVQSVGYQALLPFAERFFTVGAHIAMSAVAGYGLARGLGWQFYLIAAGMHAVLNYAVILLNTGKLTTNQTEIYVAALAIIFTVVVIWLRWRQTGEAPEAPVGPVSDGYLSGPESQAERPPGAAGNPDTPVDTPADHPDDLPR